MSVILIVGNPVDGLTTYGPFCDVDEAEEWVYEQNITESWWTTTLAPPHTGYAHDNAPQPALRPYQRDDWTNFDHIAINGADFDEEPWHFQVRRALDPEYIIRLPEDDEGRSNWFWLRTPNNDLMLACFPRGGEGYEGSEPDWGRA